MYPIILTSHIFLNVEGLLTNTGCEQLVASILSADSLLPKALDTFAKSVGSSAPSRAMSLRIDILLQALYPDLVRIPCSGETVSLNFAEQV